MKLKTAIVLILVATTISMRLSRKSKLRKRKEPVDEETKKIIKSFLESKDLIPKKELGKGGFGIVYSVEQKSNSHEFAAKGVYCRDDKEEQKVDKEIKILKEASTVPFSMPICQDFKTGTGSKRVAVMVFPKAKTDLKKYLIQTYKEKESVPSELKYDMLANMAIGVKYLHQKGFIHRDIKPENLMITKDDDILLADYGISVETKDKDNHTGPDGTGGFVPHDIHLETEDEEEPLHKLTPERDVFALGIVMSSLNNKEFYNCYVAENDDCLLKPKETFNNVKFYNATNMAESLAIKLCNAAKNNMKDSVDKQISELICSSMIVPLDTRISSAKVVEELAKIFKMSVDQFEKHYVKHQDYCKGYEKK